MEEIWKTPAIIAALITGTVMAFGFIIQWLIANTKTQNEIKADFEENLREKLGNIYLPLMILFNRNDVNNTVLQNKVMDMLNRYGYLLTVELLNDLQDLCKIEFENYFGDTNQYIEYENLLAKIKKQLKTEFYELQNLYNKGFDIYKENLTKQWYIKAALFIKNSVLFVTGVFWVTFLIINIIQKKSLADGSLATTVAAIVVLIILIATSFLLILGGLELFSAIERTLYKRRKVYKPYDYVPATGVYRCIACGEKKKYYKYEMFKNCSSNKLKAIVAIFFGHIWVFDSDVNGDANS